MSPALYDELLKLLTDNLWKALPAVVIALLTFGFKRMTARTLGVFEQVKQLFDKVSELQIDFRTSRELIDERHKMNVDHLKRIESAVTEQQRRIDSLHALVTSRE